MREKPSVPEEHLRDQGIASVVAPPPTKRNILWAQVGAWTVIVSPFLEGDTSWTGMTDELWKEERRQRWRREVWGVGTQQVGRGMLARGRKQEQVVLVELSVEERSPILREFPRQVPHGVPFFEKLLGLPGDPETLAAAPRRPVFRLDSLPLDGPPQPRNGAALAGFILGIIGLVLCAGHMFDLPVLAALFLVCGFPVTFIGILVSAVGCGTQVRRAKALWGLLFSFVAFILFIIFTFIVHPTRSETQGSGTIVGIVLLVIEGAFSGGFGAVLPYAAILLWWRQLRMRWRGVTVEGSITDHRTETTYSGRGGGTVSYYVTYDYRYAGEDVLA